ncbi:MAG: 4a-hydroxytetrahydrobiopterin dehydratase [Gammaproteobacteria bacterium]|nr:4a-hydroxytetrahydrobiopterin dehydratase [Gammaproteobacteria bacterium]
MSETMLSEKRCVPCEGGVPRLDRATAGEMIKQVPGWSLNDDVTRVNRTFSFKSFAQAQRFANAVAELAEAQFHHPEITFGWGFCTVMFQTRKIRGLHENDFIMAAKLNDLYEQQPSQ